MSLQGNQSDRQSKYVFFPVNHQFAGNKCHTGSNCEILQMQTPSFPSKQKQLCRVTIYISSEIFLVIFPNQCVQNCNFFQNSVCTQNNTYVLEQCVVNIENHEEIRDYLFAMHTTSARIPWYEEKRIEKNSRISELHDFHIIENCISTTCRAEKMKRRTQIQFLNLLNVDSKHDIFAELAIFLIFSRFYCF